MAAIELYRKFLSNLLIGLNAAARQNKLEEEYSKIAAIRAGLAKAFHMDQDIIDRKKRLTIYTLIKIEIIRALMGTTEMDATIELHNFFLDDLLYEINAMRGL